MANGKIRHMKSVGIILAGGRGTRFKSDSENKTAAKLSGKPLVMYAVELFEKSTDLVEVVVGAFPESVKNAIGDRPNVIYAFQNEQLGTGHAVQVAVEELEQQGIEPELVVVGYGDHMMFYTPEAVRELIELCETEQAEVALLTTDYPEPDKLKWGKIVRNREGHIQKIVEQKDADEAERKLTEVNPGFYCFKYQFLKEFKDRLQRSPVSDEYYITEFVQMAVNSGLKVVPLRVPFSQVGLGVNTKEELAADEVLNNPVTI